MKHDEGIFGEGSTLCKITIASSHGIRLVFFDHVCLLSTSCSELANLSFEVFWRVRSRMLYDEHISQISEKTVSLMKIAHNGPACGLYPVLPCQLCWHEPQEANLWQNSAGQE